MLSFDPNEYRARLNQALNLTDPSAIGASGAAAPPAQINNPYDTEEQQQRQQPQQQPKQGGMNLGAIAQQAMGAMGGMGQGGKGSAGALPDVSDVSAGESGGAEMSDWVGRSADSNLGAMSGPMIDESGAMGGAGQDHGLPIGNDGKIQTRPDDLDLSEIDTSKMGKANTIDQVFDAAPKKTQDHYMDWWEKAYGSINQKYDRMRGELGDYKKLPEKMSRKQKFLLLLGYGARMASNMRRGSNADPMAASDDAFQFGQDAAMGNTMSEGQHDANLGAIEQGRAAELKNLGSKGDAMVKESEINLRDAQADNLRSPKDGKDPSRITDDQGYVMERQKDGSWARAHDGKGNPIKQRAAAGEGGNSEFERAKDSYLQAWGYDDNGKKKTGAAWQKALQAANDFARYGSREKENLGDPTDALRTAARERVNTIMRSSPDTFRELEPDELNTKLGQMEEQEYNRLKKQNLGSSPIHDGPRAAAPSRSENYVRSHPDALADFVTDYGYVPEGMESLVTPEIRAKMGR